MLGTASLLVLLVLTQFALGLTTWVVKFGFPIWFADYDFAQQFVVGEKTLQQMNLITAHVAVGSLILCLWTIQALRVHRWNWWHQQGAADVPQVDAEQASGTVPAV